MVGFSSDCFTVSVLDGAAGFPTAESDTRYVSKKKFLPFALCVRTLTGECHVLAARMDSICSFSFVMFSKSKRPRTTDQEQSPRFFISWQRNNKKR